MPTIGHIAPKHSILEHLTKYSSHTHFGITLPLPAELMEVPYIPDIFNDEANTAKLSV